VQFTSAHEFGNGDEIEFFGFDNDSTGRNDRALNTKRSYVGIVDGFSVVLYEDSGLTKLEQIADMGFFAQSDIFFTMLDDGTGSEDAVVHFDGFSETMATGDTLTIADPFNNLTGTVAGSSGDVYYLEKISNNSYKLFTDSGRTTNATITSGQGKDKFATTIPFSVASSGSAATVSADISGGTFATLRGQIEGQNMTPNVSEDTTNIFRGFCRVQITAGTGTSKTIPSSLDDTAFFGYVYTKSTGNITILKDPCGTLSGRDTGDILTATNGSGNITGNIKIIDFWSYRVESPGTFATAGSTSQILPASGTNVGGMYYFGTTNDTSLTPITPLTHPLASEKGTLYQGNKTTSDDNQNFDKLIYHLFETNTRSTGTIQYQYQNSSNATVNGAVYDFTKFWRPGATSAFTPTYITTPTATPNLSTQGYINGTNQVDVFPQRGLFTLAGLGLTSSTNVYNTPILSGSPAKPSTHVIERIGVFPINAKADEYVAPTAYAPDVFDTDDEWDTDAFDDRKNWPTHITPNGINITQNIPSSTTLSQNGTKYVRSSGVIKHQLEVSYPPMTYDDFREFEAVHQAARGQATPLYFIIKNTGQHLTSDLIWHRTDTANSSISTEHLRIRQDITDGTKTFLVEGFRASEAKCFIRGECLIVPSNSSNNGSIRHVINDDVTSNKYGEAKIRFAVGMNNETAGRSIYKNPFHLRVTMAEDALEYEVGTDKLYRLTCRFDLDEFK
jgi:hypothetical protein